MLSITKLYDYPGWAYDFIGREMKKYSRHLIYPQAYNKIDYMNMDIMMISSPNISYSETAGIIPNECKRKGIKVIGQYCGEVDVLYSYADLILTISPQLYLYAKEKYKNTPVIFLPESVDTQYFTPTDPLRKRFTPGWAGGAHKPIKRTHLLSSLKYPTKIQSEHGMKFFIENRSREPMKEFYKSIDCFINVSETECLPHVILEAMACGLPIISTDVGGVPLLIPDEYIVSVYPEELVVTEVNKRLEGLANNFELRQVMGQINRAWCERLWSWEANIELWDDVFSALKDNDFKTIQKISDNCISNFGTLFEMNDKYKNQISKFTQLKIENQVRITPTAFDHAYINIIEDLSLYSGMYWLAKSSCLDVVNRKRITTDKGQLYLGINNEENKQKFINYLLAKGANVTDKYILYKGIQIFLIKETIIKTKTMNLYDKSVQVPYPVVPYLLDYFGRNWETK